MDFLKGWKTRIAAVGSVAFGVYLLTQGNIEAGAAAILGGLAALGIGEKIERKLPDPTPPNPAPPPAN